MKILLVSYWCVPYVGGVSAYTLSLKKGLEQQGHEVEILSHHPDNVHYYMMSRDAYLEKKQVKQPINQQINDYYDKYMPHVDPVIREMEIERYSFEAATAFFGIKNYDVIHTQEVISTRAVARLKQVKTPLIATIHGALPNELLSQGVIKDKNSLSWRYAVAQDYYGTTSSDLALVPTQWMKQLLSNDFYIPKEHLIVQPLAMEVDVFLRRMEEPSSIEVPLDKKVILCPARLDRVKGHSYLLDALALLKQERTDWICWFAGDGYLQHDLKAQCQSLDLGGVVRFLGHRDDVPALIKLADVVVLPSLHDNHPFAVMEAQVAGKPVVATDAGGIPELIRHEKTGLLTPTGQSNPLYFNLKRILEDDQLRQYLGEQAKIWGCRQWSLETMTHRIIEVYDRLLHEKSKLRREG